MGSSGFNPEQPRDDTGKWTDGGSSDFGAVLDGGPGLRDAWESATTPAEKREAAVAIWQSTPEGSHFIRSNPDSPVAQSFREAVAGAPDYNGQLFRGVASADGLEVGAELHMDISSASPDFA